MFCISGVRTKGSEAAGPPKKKRKKTQKKSPEQEQKAMDHKTKPLGKKSPTSSRPKKPMVSKQENSSSLGSSKGKWLQDVHGQGWDGPRHKCPHSSIVLAGFCPVLHDNRVTRHYLFFCAIGTSLIVQLQVMCFKGAWVELLNGGL